MKDELMLEFYKAQAGFDADSFAKWRAWCIDHAEPTGSYSEFVGRLKRCHLAQLRVKPIARSKHQNAPHAICGALPGH